MKPPRFDYYRPESLDDALEVLSELGDEAKVLAGGQSLVPLLNFRLAQPQALVDLNGLSELDSVRLDGDVLRIGALTRHRRVELDPDVGEACPLLAEAIGFVGYPAIRTRGTVGGSVAHADPSAEIPAVLAALEGQIVLRSAGGERVAGPDEFFITYFMTSLQPGEILAELRFPAVASVQGAGGRVGHAFVEFARRHGDFALAGVAAQVAVDGQGRIEKAWLGLCGAGPVPIKARAAEQALLGEAPTPALLRKAAAEARAAAEPETDLQATAEYRRDLVGVLTERALVQALDRAGVAVDGAGDRP